MGRRFLFFGIGVLISIIFLSMGPENRLTNTFYAYINYFDINKRVIAHLDNNSTTFTIQAECQLIHYNISKEDLLSVLVDGKVNFNLSDKNTEPCQYYIVENIINKNNLSVKFEYCYTENTVRVITFTTNHEKEVCVF